MKTELLEIIEQHKKQGKIIVTCNGSFDILHIGHLEFLEEAKQQGDILIVGINSDASVRRYKGNSRPVFPEEQRLRLVQSLKPVDYAFIFEEDNPIPFLKQLKPDIHANGVEYGKNCIEAKTIRRYGGRIYLITKKTRISTTDIVEKIRNEN